MKQNFAQYFLESFYSQCIGKLNEPAPVLVTRLVALTPLFSKSCTELYWPNEDTVEAAR